MGVQRKAGGILIGGVLGAAGAFGTADAPAATWTGETHGKIIRSTRLVSGATNWRGTLWFRTTPSGAIRGHAIVAYEPVVDVAGMNNAIVYVKTVGSTALGLLGPYGSAASGAVLGQIVGASVSFKSALAIRRGTLTGRMQGDKVTLRWDSKLPGIPYDINFILASGRKRIGGGEATLADPFDRAAERVGRRLIVSTSEANSRPEEGLTQTRGAYWTAHRVD